MERIIEHNGIVDRAANGTVFVRITASTACGACRAREACGMGEAQEKMIEVATSGSAEYMPGDEVTVGVQRRIGGVAVAIAYVGALAVLLVVLIVTIEGLGWSEGAGALSSLIAVGVYYGCLWLARRKIENKIHFTITKR